MGSGASRSSKQCLYIASFSAPCRAVLLAVKTANIHVDILHLDLFKEEHKREEFVQKNPEHTVPTLIDREQNLILWESRAIMMYLIDQYAPDHPIYPKSAPARAQIDRLLFRDISFAFYHISNLVFTLNDSLEYIMRFHMALTYFGKFTKAHKSLQNGSEKSGMGCILYPTPVSNNYRVNLPVFKGCNIKCGNYNAKLRKYPHLFRHEPPDPQNVLRVEEVMEYFELSLKEDFLTGNSVTIADFSIMATFSILEALDWQFSRWPKVETWCSRMRELPYYQEVNKPWEDFKQLMKHFQTKK